MLRRLGFRVLEAEDGANALEVFREHRAEVLCVLCDLTMPRLDGWETLAALRQMAPDLPVILSSGHSETRIMEGEHLERPQAYLCKPFELDRLRAVLDQVLACKG